MKLCSFIHDHTLHRGKKTFLPLLFRAFSTEKISKSHIKDYLKINSKQRIVMPKKDEYVKFKNYERNVCVRQSHRL